MFFGLQFTVYGLQMITVQAIRFVYSLKFIVYRWLHWGVMIMVYSLRFTDDYTRDRK